MGQTTKKLYTAEDLKELSMRYASDERIIALNKEMKKIYENAMPILTEHPEGIAFSYPNHIIASIREIRERITHIQQEEYSILYNIEFNKRELTTDQRAEIAKWQEAVNRANFTK